MSEKWQERKLLFQAATTPEVVVGAFATNDEWLSRNQIAGRCFRRVTPRFIYLLEQLVAERRLVRATEPLANGYKKFWYRLAGGAGGEEEGR